MNIVEGQWKKRSIYNLALIYTKSYFKGPQKCDLLWLSIGIETAIFLSKAQVKECCIVQDRSAVCGLQVCCNLTWQVVSGDSILQTQTDQSC